MYRIGLETGTRLRHCLRFPRRTVPDLHGPTSPSLPSPFMLLRLLMQSFVLSLHPAVGSFGAAKPRYSTNINERGASPSHCA